MQFVHDLYAAHPFWVWLALGAVLLALEVVTGTGYLLWPAASAGLVAVLTLTPLHLGLAGELVVFALVTLVATITARRYLPTPFHPKGPDINDSLLRLVGHQGETARPFEGGQGRVFVDGKEWAAELEGSQALDCGARVEVVGVKGGSCLRVRPA